MTFKTVYVLQARGWSFSAVAVYDSEEAAIEGAMLEGLEVGTYEIQACDFRTEQIEPVAPQINTHMADGTERAAELREQAQVALTAVQYTQDQDQERGEDAMEMLFQSYSRDAINQGGMLALTVLMAYEARELGIPLSERVANVRDLIREGFEFAIEDDDDEEGAQ